MSVGVSACGCGESECGCRCESGCGSECGVSECGCGWWIYAWVRVLMDVQSLALL